MNVSICVTFIFSHKGIILVLGMRHAHIFRELLLAVYVSIGVGKYDSGVQRTTSVRPVPDSRVPQPLRVHGPDDHVQEPGSSRGQKVRGHAQLGPKQNQIQIY